MLSKHRVAAIGIVIGMLTIAVAYSVRHDLGVAAVWGLVVALVVAGADPRWFLGGAVLFLVLSPLFLLFNAGPRAETAARVAFYLLAFGVVLEFRQDFPWRVRGHGR